MWDTRKNAYRVISVAFIFAYFFTASGQSCLFSGLSRKQKNASRRLLFQKDRSFYLSPEKYHPVDLLKDVLLLNLDLVTFDTYAIFASIFPFYIAARMHDEKVHSYFYCRAHHKNRCQMPQWCDNFARFGMAIPIIGLGSLAFFSSDAELRLTSWAFVLGLPFLVFGNKITKKIRFEACYRPWNEHFSSKKRSPGGFPSGHAAYVTYMTVLYGLRYGRSWAIPLGLYSAFVGINFCVCNRHYFSQIIAGIGLGTMYAFAANRFVESRLAQKGYLYCGTDSCGTPGIGVRFKF